MEAVVTRRLATALLAAAATLLPASSLAGCTAGGSEPDGPGPPRGSGQEQPRPEQPGGAAPGPSAPIPRAPAALAERLTETQRALAAAIDTWPDEGDLAAWPPPRDVTLLALHQLRIHLLDPSASSRLSLFEQRALSTPMAPEIQSSTTSLQTTAVAGRRYYLRVDPGSNPAAGPFRLGVELNQFEDSVSTKLSSDRSA